MSERPRIRRVRFYHSAMGKRVARDEFLSLPEPGRRRFMIYLLDMRMGASVLVRLSQSRILISGNFVFRWEPIRFGHIFLKMVRNT